MHSDQSGDSRDFKHKTSAFLPKGFFFFLWIEVAQGRMIKSKAKAWKGRRESPTLSLCWRQSPTRLLTDSYTTGKWWTGGRQIESHCNYNWTLTQFCSHQDWTVQYHTLSAQQRKELTLSGGGLSRTFQGFPPKICYSFKNDSQRKKKIM